MAESKTLPAAMRARVIAAVERLIAQYPDLNLREIGELVQIAQPVLSAMRHGRSIGLGALIKLRDATGESIDDLLGLDPPRKPKPPPATPPSPPVEEARGAELERLRATVEGFREEIRAMRAAQSEPPAKRRTDAPPPTRRR